MNNQLKPGEKWHTRYGFLMAAAGVVIGFRNFVILPLMTANNGGLAFLILYFLIILLMGGTLLAMELALGRRTQLNPFSAFKSHGKLWPLAGIIIIIVCYYYLSNLSFTSILTTGYVIRALTGAFAGDTEKMLTGLISDPIEPLILCGIFLAVIMIISYLGARNGIEKVSKFLVPAIFVILLLIIVRALTLPGSVEGLALFLKPDFGKVGFRSVITAFAQAFSALSLGTGVFIIYGSYLDREAKKGSLVKYGIIIPLISMLALLMSGSAIFSVIHASASSTPNAINGMELIYVMLPEAFYKLPLGGFAGFIFYVAMFFADVLPAAAMLEVIVSFITEHWKWKRGWAVILAGILPVFFNARNFLTAFSQSGRIPSSTIMSLQKLSGWIIFIIKYLTILSPILLCILVGWVWKIENSVSEITGIGSSESVKYKFWSIAVKYIAPATLIPVLLYKIFY